PTEAGSMPTYQSFGPDDRDGPEDRWKPRYSVTKNKRSPFVSWTRPLTLLCSTSIDVGVPRSLLQVGSSTSGKGRAARSSPLQKLSPLSKDIWSKRGVDRRGGGCRFVRCLSPGEGELRGGGGGLDERGMAALGGFFPANPLSRSIAVSPA